jgi:HK97 family phage portal protein
MSPISYAAASIRLGVSYENYGVNFYANAATPSGIFRTDRSLSDDAYTRLRKTLTDEHVGLKKAGVPMLLEEGLDWKQLTVNPIDAQLLESKYFQIEDIARIYRVPQHLIGLLEHATFSNIEFQSLNFAMYTMLPIFKRFEDNINSQLLTPDQRKAGYYSEFKMDGLLRGDAKSRAEAYATGRLNSWLSPNDIRKLENLPGIEGGDNYIQPLNYINITQADEYYSSQKNTQNTANVKFEMLAETIYKMIKDKEGQS